MTSSRSIPVWLLVTIEAFLIFILGVLGNRLANYIELSSGTLFFFTVVGLLSLSIVLYLRFAPSTDFSANEKLQQVKQLVRKGFNRIPLFQPDPLDKYKTDAERYSEASVNRWFIVGFMGGVLAFTGAILPTSGQWQLILFLSFSGGTMLVLTYLMLHSLNEESRMKREKPTDLTAWDVIGILMLTVIFLLPGWLLAMVGLGLISWIFGIQF